MSHISFPLKLILHRNNYILYTTIDRHNFVKQVKNFKRFQEAEEAVKKKKSYTGEQKKEVIEIVKIYWQQVKTAQLVDHCKGCQALSVVDTNRNNNCKFPQSVSRFPILIASVATLRIDSHCCLLQESLY